MIIIDILFVIAIIIILIFNFLVRNLMKDLKAIPNETKLSGFEIAKIVSSKLTKEEPHIIKKHGKLLDHYNYERNVIKLSDEVFDGEDLYAGIVAINIALETNSDEKRIPKTHKFTSLMVPISYLIIILGLVLYNPLFLRFGFIIFILAIIIEFLNINSLAKNEDKVMQLHKFIKSCNVIEPFEENKENLILMLTLPLARLPYSFIIYFR